MRKIADSGNAACSVAFERARRREVAAERLLERHARARGAAGALQSPATTAPNALGGMAR